MELVAPSRRHALPATVVVAEVVAALLLVGLACWCWHRGVIVTVRRGVAMNRIEGLSRPERLQQVAASLDAAWFHGFTI